MSSSHLKRAFIPWGAVPCPVRPDMRDEEIWSKAAIIDDFQNYADGSNVAERLTEAAIFRDRHHLHLRVIAREPLDIRADSAENGYPALGGDHLEIFFGESGENCWYRQFGISAGGGRFSEFAELEQWEAETTVLPGRWIAEIKIPLSLLPLEGSRTTGFNIARQRSEAKQLIVWSHTGTAFHNIDQLGRLYFPEPEPEVITHGPWVCQPACTGVVIAWESAGPCAALVEYRKPGEMDYQTAFADVQAGILRQDRTLHNAHLQRLDPGCEYEYRLKMLFPDGKAPQTTGNFKFRTNSPGSGDFSLLVISDVHCDTRNLERILQRNEARECDFAILLGDMVTASPGRKIYYDAFLDSLLQQCRKPFAYVPGNHEYRGAGAGSWFDLFAPPGGNGYFAFSHGGVFFVALDIVRDNSIHQPVPAEKYLSDQREWLKRITTSEEFLQADFRVVLSHVAILSPELASSRAVADVVDGLLTEPGGIDLMISGHEHCYCRTSPGESGIHCDLPRLRDYPAWPLPFPVVLNDYCAHLELSRKQDILYLKAFDSSGKMIEELQVQRGTGSARTARRS